MRHPYFPVPLQTPSSGAERSAPEFGVFSVPSCLFRVAQAHPLDDRWLYPRHRPRLADGEAIVDGVNGAGHRPGLVRCEESEESGHLLGLGQAPGPEQSSCEVRVNVVGKRGAEGDVRIGSGRARLR